MIHEICLSSWACIHNLPDCIYFTEVCIEEFDFEIPLWFGSWHIFPTLTREWGDVPGWVVGD